MGNGRMTRAIGWHRLQFVLWIGVASILFAGAATAAEKPPAVKPAAPAAAETPRDLEQLRALEKQVESLAARVLPAVVGLHVGQGQGSGVIVSRDGYIVTAGHLITKPGQEVTVVMADGKTHKGTTLGFDRIADSGLVKITDAGTWPSLEMGDAHGVREGAWCIAVGHPLGILEGRPPVVRLGRVLSISDQVLRTDCVIVAGDSGGPLVDLSGKVIAVNVRIGALANQNYHEPINVYRQQWQRLAAGEMIHVELPGKDSREVKTPLRPVVSEASRLVVRVCCDGRDGLLGTIVGPHGWVLTKASELHGKLTCRLRDGRQIEARIVGLAPQHDVAMLKLDAAGLGNIAWSAKEPAVGQWVIAAGLDDDPLAVGVVSVPDRKIPPVRAAMGVLGRGRRHGEDRPGAAAKPGGDFGPEVQRRHRPVRRQGDRQSLRVVDHAQGLSPRPGGQALRPPRSTDAASLAPVGDGRKSLPAEGRFAEYVGQRHQLRAMTTSRWCCSTTARSRPRSAADRSWISMAR